MQDLLNKIENLKNTAIKTQIDLRIKEFQSFKNKSNEELFKELCFCILTANYSAEGGIKIQNTINNDFLTLPEQELSKKLKQLGHRFPNTRAKYIVEARNHTKNIKNILSSLKEEELREYLVNNIKGIGYKEASHFLRNVGYLNYAIIDFHILDILERNNLITKPKTLAKKNYIEIESLLKNISQKSKITQAELDLYLWYLETGKVLK